MAKTTTRSLRCSRCGGLNDRADRGQAYCKACHAEIQRNWRAGRISISREIQIRPAGKTPSGIYVIAEAGGAFCKIGVAGDPSSRLETLQIGNGRDLTIFRSWRVPSRTEAHAIERLTLHHFSAWRVRGEWLHLSPAELADFVEGFIRSQNREEGAAA